MVSSPPGEPPSTPPRGVPGAGRGDIVAAVVLAAGALASVWALAPPPVRVPLAALLVLFLPGYTLVASLFPELGSKTIETLVLSVTLSLTVTVLGGLALAAGPGGLKRDRLAALLAAVVVVGAVGASVRRRRTPALQTIGPPLRLSGPQWLAVTAAVLLASAALGAARLGATAIEHRAADTALWLLPADGRPAAGAIVTVGVRNDRGGSTTYRLVVRAGGQPLGEWQNLHLPPRGTFVRRIAVPRGLTPGSPVTAQLYRGNGSGRPYRTATLWLGGAAR